ncbi:MAG: DsbA family protein [Lautropia sp.]|nr:DsbA family protein [Lautropia sp.]
MNKTLTYLFDPLCGWCYGAGKRLTSTVEQTGVQLQLLPTGLFSGNGARLMDHAFAAHVWLTDQRIESITGEIFSISYRDRVLDSGEQGFDSWPATLALTAVSLTEPEREFDALKAIQQARYINGLNIMLMDTLANLLDMQGLGQAANSVRQPDVSLMSATQTRIGRARHLMQMFDLRGVPCFLLEQDSKPRPLDTGAIFAEPEAFTEALLAA